MASQDFLEFEVQGLKELEAALKRLPQKIQDKALAKAVLAGAGVIRDEARRLCPKRTGKLAAAIVARKVKRPSGTGVIYEVGIKKSHKSPVYYGHMVEFGTSPHVIKAEKGKVLAVRSNKRASKGTAKRWINVYPVVKVAHPGAAPRPFLRPAFDSKYKEATEKMRKSLARAIERGEVTYWKTLKGW